MNYNFEWDPNKAKSNIEKHKISFEDATSVFKDENAVSIFDEETVQMKRDGLQLVWTLKREL